jgi:pyridoxine 5-phosphate synthase
MPLLCVNVDHVASLRQARYRDAGLSATPAGVGGDFGEPDILRAIHEAELGGADGITVHLREDRRHVTDRDVSLVRQLSRVRVNLEMAATDEMVAIACALKPHTAMLVPEGRREVTTEGGLDVVRHQADIAGAVAMLRGAGCVVSAFIDADPTQIAAARDAGFQVCEIHTGPYAAHFLRAGGDFLDERLAAELERIAIAGGEIRAAGMRFNAGHALNYANVGPIASLPGVAELHIGHAIISRAIYVGIREAVREMKAILVRHEDDPFESPD